LKEIEGLFLQCSKKECFKKEESFHTVRVLEQWLYRCGGRNLLWKKHSIIFILKLII